MIPKLHYISQGASPKQHIEHIQKACQSGAELVQLRLKDISEKKLLKIAEEAREITSHFQTRLIINDHYKIAVKVKADGVHLGKTDTCPTIVRKALASWQIIGGTANTMDDCHTLLDKQVNYIGLGPLRFTSTKQNLSPVLGFEGYKNILENLATPTPIIAIGGIVLEDVEQLVNMGLNGIAVSGEITKDFNKIAEFHKLLNAGSNHAQRYDFKTED
jgi:thiamine-phosphate pyrophosphorylase